MPDASTVSPRERVILRTVLAPFADRIERVDLFGSRALGRARPASDIDLVLHGAIDDSAVARLWSLFDGSTLAVSVDLVRYDALGDASLRRHIDRYALPLFDRADLLAARDAAVRAA